MGRGIASLWRPCGVPGSPGTKPVRLLSSKRSCIHGTESFNSVDDNYDMHGIGSVDVLNRSREIEEIQGRSWDLRIKGDSPL